MVGVSVSVNRDGSVVEEMMLLANVASAEAILKAFPSHALLRRHPTPAPRMFDPLLKVGFGEGRGGKLNSFDTSLESRRLVVNLLKS